MAVLWFCIWFLIYCSILWNVSQFMDFLFKKKTFRWFCGWGTHIIYVKTEWPWHQNSNDLIHILFCFINMCFQLLQLFKLIWEKYLKTNCQRWMFHHLILLLLMFLYTMRGIFKKNYKGGRSDWFQGLLCLQITGPLFVVHSCFCQAPGSLREGGLWIKLIKLFWTQSDNNSMVVSVHAIEGKSAM